MGHMRISSTEPSLDCLFALHLFKAGVEMKHTDRGWSYIERSERSCIRNRSGVGRAERGLVSRKYRGRCIRDTARIQRVLIGDRYALQSERVIFYPTIPNQAIKIGRGRSGVWCECSLKGQAQDLLSSG